MNQRFSNKAHPDTKAEFKRRVEFGLVAQNKVKADLIKEGVKILNNDYSTFQEHMPRVEIPEPDIECEYDYVEVRRQNFYEEALLGYAKKVDGWFQHSEDKGKELWFVMVNKPMDKIAWVSLTQHADKIYTKVNDAGDTDYALPLTLFIQDEYGSGIKQLAGII